MPHGSIKPDGTVQVTWNIQADTLKAPDAIQPDGSREPRQWLPCDRCGHLEPVRLSVVSFLCTSCYTTPQAPSWPLSDSWIQQATLEQLQDELAAAGLESTTTDLHHARQCVTNLRDEVAQWPGTQQEAPRDACEQCGACGENLTILEGLCQDCRDPHNPHNDQI